ncbi:hypothetical protein [Parabacteroides sp. PF5-6]|uniref:hypothetical protein n=1 Tax=Parabacteroides sp. PF5-6 TaxID=1742403 RepID=UPI002405E0D6|nr:hypothetical protein [Parabacteroides sp. PF5-6]
MIDRGNLFINTNCWIYILRQRQTPGTMRITFSLMAKEMLQHAPQADLLYYRQFTQVAEALAHKLLLENLSTNSLYSYIQHINPEMKDLNTDFGVLHN